MAGFNKSTRSRKIAGGGKSAGQTKAVGPGPAGMRKAGAHGNFTVGKGGSTPKGGMKGGRYC